MKLKLVHSFKSYASYVFYKPGMGRIYRIWEPNKQPWKMFLRSCHDERNKTKLSKLKRYLSKNC